MVLSRIDSDRMIFKELANCASSFYFILAKITSSFIEDKRRNNLWKRKSSKL